VTTESETKEVCGEKGRVEPFSLQKMKKRKSPKRGEGGMLVCRGGSKGCVAADAARNKKGGGHHRTVFLFREKKKKSQTPQGGGWKELSRDRPLIQSSQARYHNKHQGGKRKKKELI